MGTGNLTSRLDGQTITQSWWNDFLAAMAADFVGRNASGVPVSGNNLGNALYPWGTIFGTSLAIGGATLNTSNLESDPFQIISGRTRSTSSQPDFLRAAGSSLNFTLQGASVNLVLSMNGTAATVKTDIVTAVNVGPSASHTATVNDASLAAALSTRYKGEYFLSTDSITITGAGANITALVGKWAAFKIVHSAVTEYFLAYVESSTKLSRILRGYFLDSSGNPVNRVPVSNGDTITLLKAGWVFIDSNGTTVDVSYTSPVVDYSAPVSPATGDYWLDISNTTWKRYNGSTWAAVTRMPIGIVASDSSNCVAGRSFSFFSVYRDDNTVELEFVSTTVVQAVTQSSRISVNGKRILYELTRPKWDIASMLAASTEMYQATKQNSWIYYLYVSDQGQEWISDISPYYRPDRNGYYHPHNTWRCLGYISTDGSGNFTSSSLTRMQQISTGALPINSVGTVQLIDSSVTTAKIASGNVTQIKLAGSNYDSADIASGSTSSTSYVGIVSTSGLVCSGNRLVRIELCSTNSGDSWFKSIAGGSNFSHEFSVKLLEDNATLVGESGRLGLNANQTSGQFMYFPPNVVIGFSAPTAGTHTYICYIKVAHADTTLAYQNLRLFTTEI